VTTDRSSQLSKQSRTLGEKQRKVVPRTELATWNPGARHQQSQQLLKHERMACSAFGFFRGGAPIMAYDLSLSPNTGILCQLCGDAHVQNLGAYSGPDGRLIFDINDFDETLRGPFEWDVKRMATSILLAGRDAKLKQAACTTAAESFLSSYCGLMHRFAELPILEVARFQVHRLDSINPISKILGKAQRATPMHSLEKLTEQTKSSRVFHNCPPLLERVTGNQAKAVLASLKPYAESLLPERQHFLAQFTPLDVAFKVVGTGSVGLRDFCIYFQGNGADDPLFLQIKEESNSCYAPYLPTPAAKHNGQRAAEGQRAMQLQSDPLLGWTRMQGRDYLVRQLNDHKASVDITKLKALDLAEYATVCGEMLARGHARSGDSRMIAGYIGNGNRFREAILTFAESYANQTEQDWKDFTKSKKP
jgi:uncharacterized protein (DUF2252 family)